MSGVKREYRFPLIHAAHVDNGVIVCIDYSVKSWTIQIYKYFLLLMWALSCNELCSMHTLSAYESCQYEEM